MLEERYFGKIKQWAPAKGLGFITPNDGGKDLFCHHSVVKTYGGAFVNLAKGLEVEYSWEKGEKKGTCERACDVTAPGGGPLVTLQKPSGRSTSRSKPYGGRASRSRSPVGGHDDRRGGRSRSRTGEYHRPSHHEHEASRPRSRPSLPREPQRGGGGGNNKYDHVPEEGRFHGKIKQWFPDKGLGFITPNDGGKDVFCHHSVVKVVVGSYVNLETGTEVEYSFEKGEKRGTCERACDVTSPGGGPVKSTPKPSKRSRSRSQHDGSRHSTSLQRPRQAPGARSPARRSPSPSRRDHGQPAQHQRDSSRNRDHQAPRPRSRSPLDRIVPRNDRHRDALSALKDALSSAPTSSLAVATQRREEKRTIERVNRNLVCTSNTIPGHSLLRTFGIVRGHATRTCDGSDSQSAALWAALHEEALEDASEQMMHQAGKRGGNAIVSVRFETQALGSSGVIQTQAYGTAVFAEPSSPS